AIVTHAIAGLLQTTEPAKPATTQPKGRTGGDAPRQASRDDPRPTLQGVVGEPIRNGIHLQGRVLGSDGKPFAGAKLLLFGGDAKPVDLGSSAADGRFAVDVPRDRKGYSLVAQAE